MPTENKPNNDLNQRDGLALVVGGLFILALVFAAYNYFSKSQPETNVLSDASDKLNEIKIDEDKTDNADEDKGSINGDGATDMKILDDDKPVQPQTDTQKTEVPTAQLGTGGEYRTYWMANDYKQGDIKAGSYTVRSGDTLWEIAEAVYGNGADWVKVLNANKGSIGFLPNGSQALITAGQVLVLP